MPYELYFILIFVAQSLMIYGSKSKINEPGKRALRALF
jgi:hypothetical protein